MESNEKNIEREELIRQYEKDRKKNIRCGILIAIICLGAVLIVSAFLFRTQYPLTLKNMGKQDFSYHHVLMNDAQHYNIFNKFTDNEITYYIVYKSGNIYYEMETDLLTYSEHAKKENVAPGITNHSVIKENISKYTFLAKDGKTYCYDEKTSILKALFDAGNVTGKFIWRALCYVAGALMIVISSVSLKKYLKKCKKLSDN